MWMMNVNNLYIAKVQPLGFAFFSLALLIKVLLIKKTLNIHLCIYIIYTYTYRDKRVELIFGELCKQTNDNYIYNIYSHSVRSNYCVTKFS